MTGVHDEELVLHVGEGFVVDDLLDETLLGFGGDTLDGSRPCVERRRVESIWEDMWALVVVVHPLFRRTQKSSHTLTPCVELQHGPRLSLLYTGVNCYANLLFYKALFRSNSESVRASTTTASSLARDGLGRFHYTK